MDMKYYPFRNILVNNIANVQYLLEYEEGGLLMKQLISRISVVLVVCFMACFLIPAGASYATVAFAEASETETATATDDGTGAIGDYMKGYNPVDGEDMAKANQLASPLVNMIGTIIGVIVVIVSAGIFLVTALDLAYIGLPFTRPLLTAKYQLVSDEALACVGGGAAGQQGGMQGGMGGMSGGMGGMQGGMGGMSGGMGMGGMSGGMGMGGMSGGMGMGANGQQQGTKSIIVSYLKKRIVFLVIFALATVILLSSVFTDCGINLAALLMKLMGKANDSISNANVG